MSIVELMVGVTIGLLVVAASTLVVTTQLVENRRLIVETQIQQDLRAAADIVTRELRRAGAFNTIYSPPLPPGAPTLWTYANSNVSCNQYAALSPTGGTASEIDYRYLRPYTSGMPSLGFKLDSSSGVGVLRYALASGTPVPPPSGTCAPPISPGNWQELTDAATVNVTAFTVTPKNGAPIQIPCPKTCPIDSTNHPGDITYCWPTISVRELLVTIQGKAVSDPTVTRSINTQVRLRNDWLQFNNSATASCPA